jgi:glycosyltransferase involved in cell wall biosynthesis
MKDRHALAVVALHPIQYQAGLWRAIAAHPRIDLRVIFLDTIGVDGSIDPTLNAPMQWDIPLLEGYASEFVRNLSPLRFSPIVHRVNPTLPARLSAQRTDAVLVHGYLTLSNWLALATAKLRGAKLIYRGEGSVHGRTLYDGFWLNLLKRPLHKFFLRRCDAIGCSSEDNRRYQIARGAPPERLFSMPCAVDNTELEKFRRSALSREEFREKHGLAQDAQIVLSVGRFFENKCTSDFLDALATPSLRERADVHVALVGDGPLRGELEAQARRLGIEERVHFLGFLNQSEVVAALLAADVFALASNRDPSPKALSEALYLGLPAVSSDGVGTAHELIEPGANGFLFPCNDVPALADALGRVLADPQERARMGRRSHEIALANDFDVGVAALAQRLDELLPAAS